MEGKEVASHERIRMPLLFWLLYFIGGGWLCLLAFRTFDGGAWLGIKASAVAIGFIVSAPIIWGVSDWLRQIAMPTMFFSRGFFDTLGKKLFWAVGPQAIGMCLAIVGSSWLLFVVATPPSKYPAADQVVPAKVNSSIVSRPALESRSAQGTRPMQESRSPQGSRPARRNEPVSREVAVTRTIPGKCLLEVQSKRYIIGRCPIRMDSDGSFMIGASENDPLTYFATVSITGRDVGDGFWNEERGASHAHTPLGVLRRNGACWENETSKVCAERVVDQSAPPSSSPEQTNASEETQGIRFTDANYGTAPCPTIFEPGRWSNVENEHGLSMTATDGEKLYVGKSCDVISSRFGSGRWAWSNGGVRFQFEACYIGWPRAEPPIEDNDCKLAL